MLNEHRLIFQQPEYYVMPEATNNCREQLSTLQSSIEKSIPTFTFADKPSDQTITVDANKSVILKIGGITTTMLPSDESGTIEGLYKITRDKTDRTKLRIQVRPNEALAPTPPAVEQKDANTDLEEVDRLNNQLAELDEQIDQGSEKKNTATAIIEVNTNGTRTLRLSEPWNRVELRIQGYTNPMILKPNSISLGDLKTNGFHIEKDPKNPNAFVIQGTLGIEAVAS